MLLNNLFEALTRTGQGKTAVVGWGRGMGHKGHMMLASSVITKAKEVGGDPYFVVSRTVGKDDPLTADEKLAIYKKVFPQSGHIFQPATDDIPNLTFVLTDLNKQGYDSAVVVVGADQVKAFQYLKNYNNKPDKSGNVAFKFKNLEVISRQETGDPSAGEEGPRATPMRAVLNDPAATPQQQFQVWRDAMSPEVSDDEVLDLMAKAKERMGQFAAPKKKSVAEVFNNKETGTTHKGGVVTKTAHGIKHTKTDYDDGHGEKGRKSSGKENRYKQTPILDKDDDIDETMLPKSSFAGSDKNKLGSAAHLKGSMKRPARQGDLVGSSESIEQEHIVKVKGGYELKSKHGNKNLGKYPTKAGAEKRERQVQYFKHAGEDVEEGFGSKIAGLGLAGAMALGAGAANARVVPGQDGPDINRLTGKPNVTQVAPSDVKPAASAPTGFSKEYLQKAADPNRFGRYMISVEKAQELLSKMNAVDEAKIKGVDGKACWKGYKRMGTKKKGGRTVDNCVKVGEGWEQQLSSVIKLLENK